MTQKPAFFHGNQVNAVEDDAAKLSVSPPHSATWNQFNSTCELVVAIVSAFIAVVLFIYYTSHHRQTKTRWTVDHVNACLVPLAIALTFTTVYFMFK